MGPLSALQARGGWAPSAATVIRGVGVPWAFIPWGAGEVGGPPSGTSVGVPRAEEAGVGEEALRGVDSDSGSFPCMVNVGLLWASSVLVPGVSREHDPP